jgi:hypothetical protein
MIDIIDFAIDCLRCPFFDMPRRRRLRQRCSFAFRYAALPRISRRRFIAASAEFLSLFSAVSPPLFHIIIFARYYASISLPLSLMLTLLMPDFRHCRFISLPSLLIYQSLLPAPYATFVAATQRRARQRVCRIRRDVAGDADYLSPARRFSRRFAVFDIFSLMLPPAMNRRFRPPPLMPRRRRRFRRLIATPRHYRHADTPIAS